MTDKSWQIRSGRTLHSSAWRTIREYDAVAPTGASATYGVMSVRNLAVGILPIDAEGHTWLVGQHRFTVGTYSWELPEGGGDPELDPLVSAKRELAEEARLRADAWQPLFANVHVSNSLTDERAFAWLAWDLSPDEAPRDAVEDLTLRRVPVAAALEEVRSGKITDMFSIAMLLKADHLAKHGALPPAVASAFQA